MQAHWPEFLAPYILNSRPEEEWEDLMPEEDETPCVLLGADGRCLVYDHRPMTCRLNGIPLIDMSGEVFFDEWCTLNFIGKDPLAQECLRGASAAISGQNWNSSSIFTKRMLGHSVNELDTFIPLRLLIDFEKLDWRRWWSVRFKGLTDSMGTAFKICPRLSKNARLMRASLFSWQCHSGETRTFRPSTFNRPAAKRRIASE